MMKPAVIICLICLIFSSFPEGLYGEAEVKTVLFTDFYLSGVSQKEMQDYLLHLSGLTQEALNSNRKFKDEKVQVRTVIRGDNEYPYWEQQNLITIVGGKLERDAESFSLTILYEDTSAYIHGEIQKFEYRNSDELYALCPKAAEELAGGISRMHFTGEALKASRQKKDSDIEWDFGFTALVLSTLESDLYVSEDNYPGIGLSFDVFSLNTFSTDIYWARTKSAMNCSSLIGLDSYFSLFLGAFPVGLSALLFFGSEEIQFYVGVNAGLIHVAPVFFAYGDDSQLYLGFDVLKISYLLNVNDGNSIIIMRWFSLTAGYTY